MTPHDPHDDEAPNLTKQDAANYFGVSVTTIDRWIDLGRLHAVVTPGGRLRFSQKALRNAVRKPQ